jgi:C-terminal peptidase prc
MSKLWKGLAGARLLVLTTLFAAVFVAPVAAQHARSAADAFTNAARTAKAPAQFDGNAVYEAAFAALLDYHYTLVDPAARTAFIGMWQHKHDNDNVLSTEKGTDMAVSEMMWSLGQRFDYYFPPADTKAEHERMNATMGGVGLPLEELGLVKAIKALGPKATDAQIEPLLKLSDERPLVVSDNPDDANPAGKAHINKGDRIVAVNGDNVAGKTLEQVVATIRGTIGTKVTLSVSHTDATGKAAVNTVVLTRAEIILHVVKTDYQGSIVHIRLTNFESQFGTKEMLEALEGAARNNASGVILDLRGNPGGLVNQVLQIAQMFVAQGVILKEVKRDGDHMVTVTNSVTSSEFVISSQSDDGSPATEERYIRIPVVLPATTPVLVLIDGNSASASEILAGSMQANGRARVIGQPSYGKGVGQVVIDLPSGRSTHVTNFEFLPGGVKMDWVGIVPDIEVQLPEDADPIYDPSTDTQLSAAKLELINTATGNPTKARTQSETDARRAELEKAHKDNFQEEVKQRQEVLKKALADQNPSTHQ